MKPCEVVWALASAETENMAAESEETVAGLTVHVGFCGEMDETTAYAIATP